MNWMGLLAVIVATLCGVNIGFAIVNKDKKDLIFNIIIMVFEWCYVLFNWGV